MPISLTDIATATADYLENEVDVRVIDVTANLNPGEEGSFTITVRNAAAPTGVRLHGLVLHVEVANPAVALLEPGTSSLVSCRDGIGRDLPVLPMSARVPSMFVFPDVTDSSGSLDDTLEVGEQFELDLGYEAVAAGTTSITCHVHAAVDLGELFGNARGPGASRNVTVRP